MYVSDNGRSSQIGEFQALYTVQVMLKQHRAHGAVQTNVFLFQRSENVYSFRSSLLP